MTDEKFESVFYQYRNMVMKAAYEILKDYHLAQDVCQEVFIKLSAERLEILKTPDDMKRYLKTVACRRAIDYYRKIHRVNVIFLEDISEETICPDMDEKLCTEEFMEDMFKALEDKKPAWREIVLRVGFYDEPPNIVARDMGISINLLRTDYHRARKWICKNFENEFRYLKDL